MSEINELYLKNHYFQWLSELASGTRYTNESYQKLFAYLNEIDFSYSIGMDGNREVDGIDLRYRFGYEYNYDPRFIASVLDAKPCSVLEMMCALAIRCEESIMNDPNNDNGPDKWFWIMIKNLGLETMTDDNYDERYISSVIEKFLNREYKRNGEGGLFVINRPNIDLRYVEIWHQMCWYLDEYLNM